VAFRRKVDHIVGIILFHQAGDQFTVADVALHKDVAGIAFNVLEVFQVAGIGQLVQVDDADVLMLFQHIVHKVGTDETGTAGGKISLHSLFSIPVFEKVVDGVLPVPHIVAHGAAQGTVVQGAPGRAVGAFGVRGGIFGAGAGLDGAGQV